MGKQVGATVSTVQVLRYVVGRPEGTTSTEMARALGLNPSTCFNIARTLVDQGFLACVSGTTRYVEGPALYALARGLSAHRHDLSSARAAMQMVATRYEVAVTIWHRYSLSQMELLVAAASDTSVNIQIPLGKRLPLLVGGMGRIMALEGGLSAEQRAAIFASIKWQRPLTMQKFLAQAEQARRQGFGIDDGYMHKSVTAIAVPVRSRSDDKPVEYACSATMFRHQHHRPELQKIAEALKEIAAAVAQVVRVYVDSERPTGSTPLHMSSSDHKRDIR